MPHYFHILCFYFISVTSYRVFNIPHYFPVHNEAEVVVGIKDCGAAIRELKQVVDDFHIPLNYITEVSCDVSTSFNLEWLHV